MVLETTSTKDSYETSRWSGQRREDLGEDASCALFLQEALPYQEEQPSACSARVENEDQQLEVNESRLWLQLEISNDVPTRNI